VETGLELGAREEGGGGVVGGADGGGGRLDQFFECVGGKVDAVHCVVDMSFESHLPVKGPGAFHAAVVCEGM
jgi:hypothetical protein